MNPAPGPWLVIYLGVGVIFMSWDGESGIQPTWCLGVEGKLFVIDSQLLHSSKPLVSCTKSIVNVLIRSNTIISRIYHIYLIKI